MAKVAAPGDNAPILGIRFACASLNSGPPSPLNAAGQLAFTAAFSNTLPQSAGDFLYNPAGSGSTSEIVAAGVTLAGESQPTTSVPSIPMAANAAGETAFGIQVGTPTSGGFLVGGPGGFQGFFIRDSDGTLRKIVANGDAAPEAGNTFGPPHYLAGLDSQGGLAFTAAAGSAADGLFYAPANGNIQTIALDGDPVPGATGGAFSLEIPLAPISSSGPLISALNPFGEFASINDESDVVVRADITGGTSDSGYFRMLRTGTAGAALQPVVLEGQPAPGGGTFAPIPSASSSGSYFSLGPDGAFAFENRVINNGIVKGGIFEAQPDGTLLKILVSGDPAPGGGTFDGISMSNGLAAGSAGRFAFLSGILGGDAHVAIFATAIPAGTASTTTTLSPPASPAAA
ncbi:MAG: DUF7453 family protein, partial [Candidatus Acidiferrales bacterium]